MMKCWPGTLFALWFPGNFENISVVGEAENGRQAIEMASRLKPDIIIMDIKMPGINGIDAATKILETLPDIIIIILTAYDNFSYAQKAINCGIEGYLLKPIQKKEVVAKLSEVLERLMVRRKSDSSEGSGSFRSVPRDIRPFLEEEFIALLLGDNKDSEMFRRIQEILQTSTDSGFFLVAGCPSLGEEEKSAVVQIMKRRMACLTSRRTGRDLAFFIPRKSISAHDDEYLRLTEDFFREVSRIYPGGIRCGIGKMGHDAEEVEASYHQAVTSLKAANSENPCIFFGGGMNNRISPPPNIPGSRNRGSWIKFTPGTSRESRSCSIG